jgi:hypothetical protein
LASSFKPHLDKKSSKKVEKVVEKVVILGLVGARRRGGSLKPHLDKN